MAQNNLARNLVDQPLEKEIPRVKPRVRVRAKAKVRLRVSGLEKALITGCSVVLCILMVAVISSKIALSNSQHSLQQLDNRIERLHNSNTNLRQQMGELQSSSRLQKVAKQNGMSLHNGNIRNVTK